MSLQLQARVHALEIENRRMRELIEEILGVMALQHVGVPEKGNGGASHDPDTGDPSAVAKDSNGKYGAAHPNPPPTYAPRQMCPKCHEKPNYLDRKSVV